MADLHAKTAGAKLHGFPPNPLVNCDVFDRELIGVVVVVVRGHRAKCRHMLLPPKTCSPLAVERDNREHGKRGNVVVAGVRNADVDAEHSGRSKCFQCLRVFVHGQGG